jgi:hypothetical protein
MSRNPQTRTGYHALGQVRDGLMIAGARLALFFATVRRGLFTVSEQVRLNATGSNESELGGGG